MSDRTDDNKFILQIKITDNDDLHNSKKDDSMKRATIIGVMGGGEASPENMNAAYRLGTLIAKQGWILLNGGRNVGIMEASAKGAWDQGGLTIGILPDDNDSKASEYIKIPIITGMGMARNCINVLSSHVVVACPGDTGTLSEIALALKSNKKVILMNFDLGKNLKTGLLNRYAEQGLLHHVKTPEEAIDKIKQMTGQK